MVNELLLLAAYDSSEFSPRQLSVLTAEQLAHLIRKVRAYQEGGNHPPLSEGLQNTYRNVDLGPHSTQAAVEDARLLGADDVASAHSPETEA